MDAWASEGVLSGTIVDVPDLFEDGLPFGLSVSGLGVPGGQPLVEGRAADLQDFAEDFDGPEVSVLVDEAKSQEFSLAKKAVAFFKMSRSILSCRFSSRSRLSSSSTEALP